MIPDALDSEVKGELETGRLGKLNKTLVSSSAFSDEKKMEIW